MDPALRPKGRFFQNAWIVADLDRAIDAWASIARVGPFVRFGEHTVTTLVHRGRPTSLSLSGALAQAGDIQIELIQQTREGPSAYRDTVPAGTDGFHHMGFLAEDFDAELARYQDLGFEIASQGEIGSTRFAYIDTSAVLGVMLELLAPRDGMLATHQRIRDLARDWDGVCSSVHVKDLT